MHNFLEPLFMTKHTDQLEQTIGIMSSHVYNLSITVTKSHPVRIKGRYGKAICLDILHVAHHVNRY